ncbi:citryl-CoA lyase [Herbaspirillum sp. HC18]|nr:citryl-CoA lyase [Herbaspirillum sp. HC18]
MNGPEFLRQFEGRLKTKVGACYPGSRAVFRGHDLHAELKDMDWMELYVFGITGRRFTPPQVRLMHAIWTYTSYPDARIWNNRVAALAGSARSTGVLGTAAALAVSEASIYGGGPLLRAIDFFIRTKARLDDGGTLEECIREEIDAFRIISGYGRPIASADERIKPLVDLARSLGLDKGPCLRLAFAVEDLLLARGRSMKMNYAALIAAFGADLGFSVREFQLYMFPLFIAGMPPCVVEANERPEGALFPLKCADVLYEGVQERAWPPP